MCVCEHNEYAGDDCVYLKISYYVCFSFPQKNQDAASGTQQRVLFCTKDPNSYSRRESLDYVHSF